MNSTSRTDFEVVVGGTVYPCFRLVVGQQALTQVITVVGLGSKEDGEQYGRYGRPVAAMPLIAQNVALEIIRNRHNRQGTP